MSLITTNSNGVTSFDWSAVDWEEILSSASRDKSEYYVRPIKPNMTTRSSNFIIGFGEVFAKLGRRADAFYFYPGELQGFIESCVLATQREIDVVSRDIGMYQDLKSAMEDWQYKVEEAEYRKTGTMRYGSINMKRYEIAKAVDLAGIVDDIVLEKMGAIREAIGDYALSADDFGWTHGSALYMTVHY